MGHGLDHLAEELAALEADGLLLHPRTLDGPTGARASFDGHEVINLASNNYLGSGEPPTDEPCGVRRCLALGRGDRRRAGRSPDR